MVSVPEVVADASAEDAIDERIDGAIEWRRRLYKGSKRSDTRPCKRQHFIDVEKVEHEEGTPTQDKHCKGTVQCMSRYVSESESEVHLFDQYIR